MATTEEIKLMDEITHLAIKITTGKSSLAVSASYIGHINAFQFRVLEKESLYVVNPEHDWINLSGRDDIWDEAQSVSGLIKIRDYALSLAVDIEVQE